MPRPNRAQLGSCPRSTHPIEHDHGQWHSHIPQYVASTSPSQTTLEEFARHNSQLIESELHKALSDPELKTAISLAYAALIIELGWQTHNPANDKAILLLERATDNDLLIPNIVEMWGPNAILNFFQYATDFAVRNLNQTT